MNISDKFKSFISILKVRFLNEKIPIAVRVELTNRCPNKCIYCDLKTSPEPSKEEIFRLIEELKAIGTQKISFSGGEPMLREDIGEIIDFTVANRISAEMNSCGFMVKNRIDKIKNLDVIKISLDGPENIHSIISGRKDSFSEAISAIEVAKNAGIVVVIVTTLTKYNTSIEAVNAIIDIAKRYDVMVAFQPVKKMYYSKFNLTEIMPEPEKYRKVIDYLIEFKKKNPWLLRNTLRGLKYIYDHPVYKNKICVAGRLFVIIDVDGTVYPCDRVDFKYDYPLPDWRKLGIKGCLDSLKSSPECSGCGFCGAIELGFLMDFKLEVLSSIKRLLR